MNKRLIIGISLLFLFSTYNIKVNKTFFSNLQIKKITIENNKIIKEEEIKEKLSFLYETNFFFLRTKNIEKKLKEIQFIESYQIKKIYPNNLRIKIIEKKPIVIIQRMKQKKYFTDRGDLIDFRDIKKFKDLPIVFGDKKSFSTFYLNLKNINFPIEEIDKFYLFKSKRWDLLTLKNQLIKLPVKDYNKSLLNFISLKDQAIFEKYKIFDYRIKNQLILK
tara:strand:- start:338 stop:997 length:660 start_codon:yes stop_codon:yes gene_type:complete